MRSRQFCQRLALAAVAATVLTLGAGTASATSIIIPDSGILNISNMSGDLIGITTSPTECISFSGAATCAGSTHTMLVSGSSSIFAITPGTITDIGPVPPPTLSGFETVTGAGAEASNTIEFDLTSLLTNGGSAAGNCLSNAAFNSCTPANSPFTFAENSNGTELTISFSTLMNAYTGAPTTGTTPYQGIFSTQLSGHVTGLGACSGVTADITDVLSCEAAGGTIQSTWSATESPVLNTNVPEPASGVLLGSALFVLGLCFFRSRQGVESLC